MSPPDDQRVSEEKVRCVDRLRLPPLVKPKVASGRQAAVELGDRDLAVPIIVVATAGPERDHGQGEEERTHAERQSSGEPLRSSPDPIPRSHCDAASIPHPGCRVHDSCHKRYRGHLLTPQ